MIIFNFRWRFSSECPVKPCVYRWGGQYIFAGVSDRVQKRLQLFSQRTAINPTRSSLHHRLHAKATRRPGSNQRLEVRSNGCRQILFNSVHIFYISRHYCCFIFSATHNCWVTEDLVFISRMSNNSYEFVKYLFSKTLKGIGIFKLKYSFDNTE